MVCTFSTEPQFMHSTAIPLHSLCAVQISSAPVLLRYICNSTTILHRTVSTETQCLYITNLLLLHLWAVRPSTALSSFTVPLNVYSYYGSNCIFRTSLSVNLSNPLIPLRAVQPVKSLRACILHLNVY